jgi:hypothetical protein
VIAWGEMILLGIKTLLAVINWYQEKQQFNAGQDAEIAKNAVAILEKTSAGKKIMEKINAMSDGDLDSLIDDLGRPG